MIQAKPLADRITPLLQRQVDEPPVEEEEEEEDPFVQTKREAGRTPAIAPKQEASMGTLRGGGQPLAQGAREFFEPRFGTDFSHVRIHAHSEAAATAKSIQARAFTRGSDLVFGAGQYTPDSTDGRRLLAHELTHTIQQARSGVPIIHREANAGAETATPRQGHPASRSARPVFYWSVDRARSVTCIIPQSATNLQIVSAYVFGDAGTTERLASANGLDPAAEVSAGRRIRVTGITGLQPTPAANRHFRDAVKVPAGVENPAAWMERKRSLDSQFEIDLAFVVRKLDESHYSDSDEGAVIDVLRRLGREPLTVRPDLYPNGGEYLDTLFTKLTQKTKDVGIVATQISSYYSLIFNHFDRVSEVAAIRDAYSRNFSGESGNQEMSFGSFFWDEVKEGRVRDQIFAYAKGVGEGVWSGAKGTGQFAYTLVTDPAKAWEDFKNIPGALKLLWEKRDEFITEFMNASPEEQAGMIGRFIGEVEFAIGSAAVGAGAAKGVAKLAETSGKVGKVARVAQAVSQLPAKALGAAARGVKWVVLTGGRVAVEGAIFAARGLFRVVGRVLRGTWSVVERTVRGVRTKLYYFYDEAAGVMRSVEERFARLFCRCTSPCDLTPEGRAAATAETVDDFLARGGPGGSGHRSATAEGVGESFSYELHPELEPFTVEPGRVRPRIERPASRSDVTPEPVERWPDLEEGVRADQELLSHRGVDPHVEPEDLTLIDRPKGSPPLENTISGEVAEAIHPGEVVGRHPMRSTEVFPGATLREIREQAVRQGRLRGFVEAFPDEGARQVYLPTSRGRGRYIDHMYVEGNWVVLRESKTTTRMFRLNQKLRTQLDKDIELLGNFGDARVEWRISGDVAPDALRELDLLVGEHPGRFLYRLDPPGR